MKQRTTAKDFDWSGGEDFYQFLDQDQYQNFNCPIQRARDLWQLIFQQLQDQPKLEKLKDIIDKALNQPETQESLEKRKSLDNYLKKQAQKIQGETQIGLEESQGKAAMIESIHASFMDRDQSQLNHQASSPVIENMKSDFNKLFKIKKIDQQEFEQLKSSIGYRHPHQRQIDKINQFRQQ